MEAGVDVTATAAFINSRFSVALHPINIASISAFMIHIVGLEKMV